MNYYIDWYRVYCSCGLDIQFPVESHIFWSTAIELAIGIHDRNNHRKCPHGSANLRVILIDKNDMVKFNV